MKMKIGSFILCVLFIGCCFSGICEEGCSGGGGCSGNCPGNCGGSKAESSQAKFSAPTLLALIRAKSPLAILDCRDGLKDDGKRIPTAKKVSLKSTPEQLEKLLPKKDILIVIYDDSPETKNRTEMAESLRKNGYDNIIDFPDGISKWEQLGNPVEKAAATPELIK